MRTFYSILATLAFTSFVSTGSAAETNSPVLQKIGATDADKYYDQQMIVTGKVAQVTILPSITFLNLDKPYPNSPFTIVIFHGHGSFYGDVNSLKGRSVEIEGKIKNYNDKPEIALDNMEQLTVIGGWSPGTNAPPPKSAPPKPATNAPPATQSTNLPDVM